jgi:fluoride exporter
MDFIFVGIGGFLGAIARFSLNILEKKVISHSFPLATLLINIVGCFIAGIIISKVQTFQINRTGLLFLLVGFTGSFTTFSTLMVDSVQLLKSGNNVAAVANLFLSIALGSSAVLLGMKSF